LRRTRLARRLYFIKATLPEIEALENKAAKKRQP
jgi:hypothetical protein